MNKKIHNNLNIENLIKTEWFNQFNLYQKDEIMQGIEADLDVLLYAKSEYNEHQMSQIRIGLKNNLDISLICENFDDSHKSCYYSFFMIPPPNMFKAFFNHKKKVL